MATQALAHEPSISAPTSTSSRSHSPTPTRTLVVDDLRILFSPFLAPYKPPRAPLAVALWRRRVWFEATFGLCGYEPWEKAVALSILLFLFALALVGLCAYFPYHLARLYRRTLLVLHGADQWQWQGVWPEQVDMGAKDVLL